METSWKVIDSKLWLFVWELWPIGKKKKVVFKPIRILWTMF